MDGVVVRVLIVDDQAVSRRAVRRTVAFAEGFVVVGEARTGEEAVRAALDLRPELVLMDVRLPGMDGFEAAQRIVSEHRATVVLIVSAYGPEELHGFDSRLHGSGSSGYIPKSHFTPDRLYDEWARASPRKT